MTLMREESESCWGREAGTGNGPQGGEGVLIGMSWETSLCGLGVKWERLGEGCGKMRWRSGQGPDPGGRGTE